MSKIWEKKKFDAYNIVQECLKILSICLVCCTLFATCSWLFSLGLNIPAGILGLLGLFVVFLLLVAWT